MGIRSPAVGLLALVLVAAPLAAQSPTDRLALAREADALQAITDVATLPDSLVSARAPTNLLQDGLRLLREGQLAHDRGLLFDALQTFDRARMAEPAWPWPRFGLALTKLALHADGAISRPELGGQLAGESYLEGYERSLRETFARDSMFEPALRLAVTLAARERDLGQPGFVSQAVQRAAQLWPKDSLTHLALGFLYRNDLRYSNARSEFEHYAQWGGDPSVAALEQARSLAGEGRLTDAAERYRLGSYHLGDTARARYRQDLMWIATAREMGSFDSLSTDSIPDWLTRFWLKRDALELRGDGDRLQEHLRRWVHVYRKFRVPDPERLSELLKAKSPIASCSRVVPDSVNELLLAGNASVVDDRGVDEAVLDHRAIIYMRHGEPAWGSSVGAMLADTAVTLSLSANDGDPVSAPPRIGSAQDRLMQSMLWVYWIQGRGRAYFFEPARLETSHGPFVLSPTLPLNDMIMWRLSDLDPVFERTEHRIRAYGDGLGHATPLLCQPSVQDMLIRTEADVKTAVRTDSYSLLFPHELNALMQVYAVGNAARGTARLLVTSAVPAAKLDSLAAVRGGTLEWPLHVRVTAVDTLRGTVVRSDTVRTFTRQAPLPAGGFLGFTTELPVAAGRYATHAGVFDTTLGTGTASAWGNVAVPSSAFSISDVVLRVEAGGVLWENGGDPFQVNVTGAYHRDQPAPIYFEIYGRTPGRAYRTSIAVHERGKPNKRGVTLEFTRTAEQPDEHVRLTLDLSRLGSGQHELTVTIRDEVTGAEVRTDRVVEIVNR
jgi:hypothetical protein